MNKNEGKTLPMQNAGEGQPGVLLWCPLSYMCCCGCVSSWVVHGPGHIEPVPGVLALVHSPWVLVLIQSTLIRHTPSMEGQMYALQESMQYCVVTKKGK
jgi:hypothetical protein